MYLHIEFEDGSNPYLFRGEHPGQTTKADCLRELDRWKQNYDVIRMKEEAGGIYVTLRQRGGADEQ